MKPIVREEILDLTAYERIRPEMRRAAIAERQKRRVLVGDKMSLVFENRETVRYQIQEMIRAERIVEAAAVDHEIETYNELLPRPNQLAATLFIEADPDTIREDVDLFLGLDRGEHVWFDLEEGMRILASFAPGQSEEGKISSVQYIRFPFSPEQKESFAAGQNPVGLVVDHPNYQARTVLDPALRRALAADLGEE
ncbi:MAG: DUF3501 family protein [Candidatus Eisenbacteria bacterium]|nr:DUF3501 family protein [Candidatus Eisenbacteria bacterium]